VATKLARHEIPWTDPQVRETLVKFKQAIDAGAFADANTVLGIEWDNAAEQVLEAGTAGYVHIGMWVSQYSADTFGIKPGVDFGLTQFPALGLGHDNTCTVDATEYLAGVSGKNPTAARMKWRAVIPPAQNRYCRAMAMVKRSAAERRWS
jgi:ABC-type glycerol-3-phosphate transport system substrate-binding protein